MKNIQSEAFDCLLCLSAPCNRACPKDLHPARGVRAVRFGNTALASQWLTDACADCDAPCEKACVRPDRPIRIKEMAKQLQGSSLNFKHSTLNSIDLSIDFCGIRCENPFFLASSAIAINYDMIARALEMGWGGVYFKTITDLKIEEVSPRFDAIKDLNSSFTGFRNMEQLSEQTPEENFAIIKRLKQNFPTKIIIASIMGQTDESWEVLAKQAEAAGADMLELNFSCPQMKTKGLGSDIGQNPELVAFYTTFVKRAVSIPVIAKMTPNITSMGAVAIAAICGGADAISAINTIKSVTMSEGGMVSGKRTVSGYSGNAVKPIALKHILDLSMNPMLRISGKELQLSGIGGIETWRDALDFIQLGCQNVQVCTAVMQYGYRIIEDLKLGLQNYMAEHNVAKLSDLVGSELGTFVAPDRLDRKTMVYPKFEREKCVGCGRCYLACQDAGHQALEFDFETRQPKLNGNKCVGCHLCRFVCQQGAIDTTNRIPKPIK